MGVLKKEQEALLKEERRIINDLQMALVRFGGSQKTRSPCDTRSNSLMNSFSLWL